MASATSGSRKCPIPRSSSRPVGMEAHGSPGAKVAQQLVGLMPDALAEKVMTAR
ncbi:MAG TPA: hypothetical protein VFM57_13780 [Thermoleophilaceae bacterium]|nr:hypothetical protein [Thermoleophilaceae bacterium]